MLENTEHNPSIQQIILDKQVVADDWQVLRLAPDQDPASTSVPQGKVLLPLAVWQAQAAALASRLASGEIGVWFASDERAETLRDVVQQFPVIGVDFPKFADGRGYSTAYNLRARLGFTGQLRALGDVLRDQMFYMQRVGFNAFAPRPDRNIHDALKGLFDFSEAYQTSLDQKQPLFRRVKRETKADSVTQGMNFGDGLGI
jgi:uncharacterized protein (DUF934 family)